MNTNLEELEISLAARRNVCLSEGPMNTFPPALCNPYRPYGIGYIVCNRGAFSFKVNEEDYTANEGDTVFLPAGNIFQIIGHSEDLEAYLLMFKVEPIRDILGTTVTSMHIYSKVYPHHNPIHHTGEEANLIRYIYLINATKMAHGKSFNAYEQKLLLMSVTYNLCSIFQKQLMQSKNINARRTEVFLDLIKLIDQYYMMERGVEFYADRLCLSAKYLSGLCKSICGYTVQELAFKAIIRKAKTMLNTTNKTVQEISNEFNFPNASSFGTFFKKQTGTSPQKYREMEERGKLKYSTDM